MADSHPPVALTIAGSDCSAGAGIQADLKAFSACGVYGLTAVTCVVAEVPGEVGRIHPQPPELVGEQIRMLLGAYPVRAIKTGLLATAEIVRAVSRILEGVALPVVVDPISVASTGDELGSEGFREALVEFIRDRATLVTPNRAEARQLLGSESGNPAEDAIEISDRLGCAVLLKGGHFDGAESVDWLAQNGRVELVTGPRIEGLDVHGTGCTYSAAITARLAESYDLRTAVLLARAYLNDALRGHFVWTRPDGAPPVKALAHFPKPGEASA